MIQNFHSVSSRFPDGLSKDGQIFSKERHFGNGGPSWPKKKCFSTNVDAIYIARCSRIGHFELQLEMMDLKYFCLKCIDNLTRAKGYQKRTEAGNNLDQALHFIFNIYFRIFLFNFRPTTAFRRRGNSRRTKRI